MNIIGADEPDEAITKIFSLQKRKNSDDEHRWSQGEKLTERYTPRCRHGVRRSWHCRDNLTLRGMSGLIYALMKCDRCRRLRGGRHSLMWSFRYIHHMRKASECFLFDGCDLGVNGQGIVR